MMETVLAVLLIWSFWTFIISPTIFTHYTGRYKDSLFIGLLLQLVVICAGTIIHALNWAINILF